MSSANKREGTTGSGRVSFSLVQQPQQQQSFNRMNNRNPHYRKYHPRNNINEFSQEKNSSSAVVSPNLVAQPSNPNRESTATTPLLQNIIPIPQKPAFKTLYSYFELVHSEIAQQRRKLAFSFITEISKHVGFPWFTCVTAFTFYHRFYAACPDSDLVHQDVALACLFSASKLEETVKKFAELLPEIWPLLDHDGTQTLDLESNAFIEYKKRILEYEKSVLDSISFRFDYMPPHNIMIHIIKIVLMQAVDSNLSTIEKAKAFGWRCWCILQSSYQTTICIQYEPLVIATSCIYLGALLEKPFDPDLFKVEPDTDRFWFESLGVQYKEIEDVIHQILNCLASDSADENCSEYKDLLINLNVNRMERKDYRHNDVNNRYSSGEAGPSSRFDDSRDDLSERDSRYTNRSRRKSPSTRKRRKWSSRSDRRQDSPSRRNKYRYHSRENSPNRYRSNRSRERPRSPEQRRCDSKERRRSSNWEPGRSYGKEGQSDGNQVSHLRSSYRPLDSSSRNDRDRSSRDDREHSSRDNDRYERKRRDSPDYRSSKRSRD